MKNREEGYSREAYEEAEKEKKFAESDIEKNRQWAWGETRDEALKYIKEAQETIKELENTMSSLVGIGHEEANALNKELDFLKMRLDVDLKRVAEDEKLLQEFKDKLAGKASL